MIGEISYVASILIVIAIYLQIQKNRALREAEKNMASLMQIGINREKLEALRTDLLRVKATAVEIGFKPMERIYEIENELNMIAVRLDQLERTLIEQGLQQPSERGRVSYMLKLVNMSIAVS